MEAELPLPSPVFGGLDRTAAHDLDEPVDDLVGEPLHLASDAVVDGPELVAHLVDGDAARPVLLGASLGAVADVLAVGEDPDDGQGVAVGFLEFIGKQFDPVEPIEHLVGLAGAVFAQFDRLT